MIYTKQIFCLFFCVLLISCSSNKKSTNDNLKSSSTISIQDSLKVKNDFYFTFEVNTISYEADENDFINKDLLRYICSVFNEKCNKHSEVLNKQNVLEIINKHQKFLQSDYSDNYDDHMPIDIHYSINIEEDYSKNNIFILEKNQYSFTGGAHGNYYTQYSCYDIKEGKLLNINDVFDITQLNRVGQEYFLMQRGLQKKADFDDSGYWFEDNKFYLPNNFTIENNSFVFIYNPYEIASYAEGIIEVKIPFNKLKNTIKERYKFIIN